MLAGKDLERCQRQADEVTEIMLNNFERVLVRDGKLAELEQRSDYSAFSKTTKTLAQKKRWENIQWRVILGVVIGSILVVILITLLVIYARTRGKRGQSQPDRQASCAGRALRTMDGDGVGKTLGTFRW
uniref:V-SNARE coiled-coil homology domain-containing protein n=1 Tax=Monodelphis domestica TaxID=13616 RepID=A0A5F8GH45_MONDO